MALTDPPIGVSLVGMGTVGEWVLAAIDRHVPLLRERYSVELRVVALASRSGGFVYREQGLDPAEALARKRSGASIADLDGATHWPTALAGLRETGTDLLVEVSQSPDADGEPGISHMRAALEQGASVATSNKWPVALAGIELSELARDRRLGFRAESTVMSGTPVLSTLTEGLAGATPRRLRGVLNASVNFICSRIGTSVGYAEALSEAQAAGLTEPDPSADVDGLDSVAKLMVISALVFGTQLTMRDVQCRGISAIAPDDFRAALAEGRRIREITTCDPDLGRFSFEPVAITPDDPFFAVAGSINAVQVEVEPLGELTISGPGAGPELAGQGVFADLIALARACHP
jgi:homoserine dehydrogenase